MMPNSYKDLYVETVGKAPEGEGLNGYLISGALLSIAFVEVFCTSLNGITYGTKYGLSEDNFCWARTTT